MVQGLKYHIMTSALGRLETRTSAASAVAHLIQLVLSFELAGAGRNTNSLSDHADVFPLVQSQAIAASRSHPILWSLHWI